MDEKLKPASDTMGPGKGAADRGAAARGASAKIGATVEDPIKAAEVEEAYAPSKNGAGVDDPIADTG